MQSPQIVGIHIDKNLVIFSVDHMTEELHLAVEREERSLFTTLTTLWETHKVYCTKGKLMSEPLYLQGAYEQW